jgi:hypothetical protein
MQITRTLTVISGVLAGALFVNIGPIAAATALKQAANASGLIVLNEVTGSITYCSPATVSNTPIGGFGGIGGIPTTSLAGNGFVSLSEPGAGSGVEFVGNIVTGFIVECACQYPSSGGSGSGKCIPVANPIR